MRLVHKALLLSYISSTNRVWSAKLSLFSSEQKNAKDHIKKAKQHSKKPDLWLW